MSHVECLQSPNSGEEEVSELRPPSQVLSPDGAAPPVPVASSSPVPLQPPAPGTQMPDTEAKEDEDDDDDDHIDHDVNETQSYHTDSEEEEGAGEAASELLNKKKMLHAHEAKKESEEEDAGEEALELLNKKMLQARKAKEESKDVVQCNVSKENEEKNSSLEARNNKEMLKVLKECKDPAINVVDKSPKPVNKELTIVSTVQEKPSTSTVDKNMLESSVARRNQEFETPAAADSAMEPSSQPSPIIAKSKRKSADLSVRYEYLTIRIIESFEY